MNIIILLFIFLLIFGLCGWVAMNGDRDAERHEDDAQDRDQAGPGWPSFGWDGDAVSLDTPV